MILYVYGHTHSTSTAVDPGSWLPQYQDLCVYCNPEGAGQSQWGQHFPSTVSINSLAKLTSLTEVPLR